MPRYTYKCVDCREEFDVFHGILDHHEECDLCNSKKLMRVPQMPHIRREQASKGDKVGEETKRAIEENRAVLKEERKKRVEYKDGD
jgi:putative FmdB family regulatory protein